MTIVELVKLFAEPLDIAIVLTDINLERSGPTILYANHAFAQMSGYPILELLGTSPRLLQGSGTSREATRRFARGLRSDGRFRGVLQNYRKSGEAYLCEIDVRAILDRSGRPEAFIAFEREVERRRGRPARDTTGRYRPLSSKDPVCPVPFGAGTDLFA